MVQDAGLALNDGRGFGPEGGGYMRMNIACPRATIERALGQLKAAVDRKMGRVNLPDHELADVRGSMQLGAQKNEI